MDKNFENKNEPVGLEEINQTDKSDMNGGIFNNGKDIFIVCYYNIPPPTVLI